MSFGAAAGAYIESRGEGWLVRESIGAAVMIFVTWPVLLGVSMVSKLWKGK